MQNEGNLAVFSFKAPPSCRLQYVRMRMNSCSRITSSGFRPCTSHHLVSLDAEVGGLIHRIMLTYIKVPPQRIAGGFVTLLAWGLWGRCYPWPEYRGDRHMTLCAATAFAAWVLRQKSHTRRGNFIFFFPVVLERGRQITWPDVACAADIFILHFIQALLLSKLKSYKV